MTDTLCQIFNIFFERRRRFFRRLLLMMPTMMNVCHVAKRDSFPEKFLFEVSFGYFRLSLKENSTLLVSPTFCVTKKTDKSILIYIHRT